MATKIGGKKLILQRSTAHFRKPYIKAKISQISLTKPSYSLFSINLFISDHTDK